MNMPTDNEHTNKRISIHTSTQTQEDGQQNGHQGRNSSNDHPHKEHEMSNKNLVDSCSLGNARKLSLLGNARKWSSLGNARKWSSLGNTRKWSSLGNARKGSSRQSSQTRNKKRKPSDTGLDIAEGEEHNHDIYCWGLENQTEQVRKGGTHQKTPTSRTRIRYNLKIQINRERFDA